MERMNIHATDNVTKKKRDDAAQPSVKGPNASSNKNLGWQDKPLGLDRNVSNGATRFVLFG